MPLKLETGTKLEQKKCKGLCIVKGCTSKAYVYVNKKGYACKSNYCLSDRRKKYNEDNPISYVYRNLKSNAKRRGKEFKISYKYFKQFCIENNYMERRGRFKGCITIDRIRDEDGYIEGNLQLLEQVTNNKKRFIPYWIALEESFSNISMEMRVAGYIEEMENEDKNTQQGLPPPPDDDVHVPF